MNFAVFNVADCFVTVGAILLAVYVIFYEPKVDAELKAKGLPNIWIPKADDFFKAESLPMLGSGKLDLKKLKEMSKELEK